MTEQRALAAACRRQAGLLVEVNRRPYLQAVATIAAGSGWPENMVPDLLSQWQRWGLCRLVDEGTLEVLPGAKHLAAAPNQFDDQILRFLPTALGDLWGRKALLLGGEVLVFCLRYELLDPEREKVWFRELVPPVFHSDLDDRLALDLFAAANSLLANLAISGTPASPAEELCALGLLDFAESVLESWVDTDLIDDRQLAVTRGRLTRLLGDTEISQLHGWKERSDSHPLRDPTSWFDPFIDARRTGYLNGAVD